MKKFNMISSSAVFAVALAISLSGPISVLAAGPSAVNLGSAGNFTVLAKSGISTTGATSISGDIGVSPISATAITGFGLVMDSSNTFSKSSLVSGNVYAATYTAPTPATMTTAVSNMETAYTDAAGRTNPTATELGAGNLGGMTLAPGLYKFSSNVTIPTDLTLSGSASDVWIFQIAGNLTVSSAMNVILSGGAQAGNVFWQVAGQATIGTTAVFNGNILSQTAIVLQTGARLNGRALAQTAVTLDGNTVSVPAVVVPPPAPVATATISANPTSVVSGSSSTVTWSSANASSCVGTNFSTGNATSGNVSVAPTTNTTYSVNCSGASASATVSVTEPTPVVVPTSTPTPAPVITPIAPATTPAPVSAPAVTSAPSTSATVTTTSVTTVSPKLPNTGLAPDENRSLSWILVLVGMLSVLLALFFSQKKKII